MHKTALVLFAFLGACGTHHGPEDEAAVLRFAIAAEASEATRGKHIVLESTTKLGLMHPTAQRIADPFRRKGVDIPEELIARFLAANQSPIDLSEVLKGDKNVTMISTADAYGMFENPDPDASWVTFYKKYGDSSGLFELSRVGFYRNAALVYVGYSCGGLCGEGHLLFLRRTWGRWGVQADVMAWIS